MPKHRVKEARARLAVLTLQEADAAAFGWPIKPSEIKALRKRLGLTLKGLGDHLGVRLNTVWRWEAGQLRPGPEFMELMQDLKAHPKVSP